MLRRRLAVPLAVKAEAAAANGIERAEGVGWYLLTVPNLDENGWVFEQSCTGTRRTRVNLKGRA